MPSRLLTTCFALWPSLSALARAARCYEKFLGDTRSYISHITGQFEAVLDKQDPREVEHARAELMKALDQLEGETWL